jgi:hypothetical protein
MTGGDAVASHTESPGTGGASPVTNLSCRVIPAASRRTSRRAHFTFLASVSKIVQTWALAASGSKSQSLSDRSQSKSKTRVASSMSLASVCPRRPVRIMARSRSAFSASMPSSVSGCNARRGHSAPAGSRWQENCRGPLAAGLRVPWITTVPMTRTPKRIHRATARHGGHWR